MGGLGSRHPLAAARKREAAVGAECRLAPREEPIVAEGYTAVDVEVAEAVSSAGPTGEDIRQKVRVYE